ncbi:unnamed protein product [[Candida] boidinii]|nr:unnamed protein product [[Candida] boidinii]
MVPQNSGSHQQQHFPLQQQLTSQSQYLNSNSNQSQPLQNNNNAFPQLQPSLQQLQQQQPAQQQRLQQYQQFQFSNNQNNFNNNSGIYPTGFNHPQFTGGSSISINGGNNNKNDEFLIGLENLSFDR